MRAWLLAIVIVAVAAVNAGAFEFSWPGGGGGSAAAEQAEDTYREARSAYGSADYNKCVSLASKAIQQNPQMAKAYALRGKAKKDMGDIDSAFKDLDKAIELDPKLGEAYFIRAQTHEIMGEMDQAKDNYKKGCAAGFRDACR